MRQGAGIIGHQCEQAGARIWRVRIASTEYARPRHKAWSIRLTCRSLLLDQTHALTQMQSASATRGREALCTYGRSSPLRFLA
jgi:hypothetical protein